MRRLFRRDQRGQLHVVEAIIVGILVFTILFVTSVFRLPTSPATFQQAELAGLAHDTLVAMLAKPPNVGADCNQTPCPFDSELERMVSLALGYEGATIEGAPGSSPTTTPLADYLTQALPPGTRYILNISNGVTGKTLYPPNIVPPALDISVGHIIMSPRWDQFATQVDQSMIIRIQEPTGFKTAEITSISDPLNRVQDEDSVLHTTAFVNAAGTMKVPDDAFYGTYQVCRASGPCTYFTVVPPGIFGPGSPILTNDRDNTTTLQTLPSSFDVLSKFRDNQTVGTVGVFDANDWIYLDLDASSTITKGDLRLTAKTFCRGTITCAAGTYVEQTDADRVAAANGLSDLPDDRVRAALTGSDGAALEQGEAVYFDSDGSGTVTANDRRLSRVGTYAFGSVVVNTDYDAVGSLAAFTSESVTWGDLDGLGDIDIGEPLYLDLAGHGQSVGLEALDLHLSPKGSPTARYVYDIKLVVWYGI